MVKVDLRKIGAVLLMALAVYLQFGGGGGILPSPAPIPEPGYRVLMVFESADMAKYPKEQSQIFNAAKVRDFLNSNCVKVNGTPEWRMYDKDTDQTYDSELWKAAMQRPRETLPWIIISNGRTGTEEPLPKTVDDTMSLLKKYVVK